jgi:hypothetical protein
MTPSPLARALLDWYRANVCDDNPRSAWHTLNRNGPLAFTACVTDDDYAVVAGAMGIAAILAQQLGHIPSGDVVFNGPRITVLDGYGRIIYTKEIQQ